MGSLVPFALLIALQVIDVVVHVATDQIEPTRIASNVVIGAGAIVALRSSSPLADRLLVAAGVAYLALNLVFLARHGLVNPSTDAVRFPLFGFVLASLALAAWSRRRLDADHR